MYLAATQQGTSFNYQIRQSYRDPATERFQYRLIFDLGQDPRQYMEFMGEAIVFFDSDLERAIKNHTTSDTDTILEKLLWNFLPREMRDRLSRFDKSDRYVPRPLTQKDKEDISSQIKTFDRKRLYFLHYRAVDQSKLYTMRDRAFRPLLNKCRDELEYLFHEKEKTLEPGEYRNYLYAIFNLQKHFNTSFSTFLPEALPQDEVADHFLDALCDLNDKRSFWGQEETPSSLRPHLVRYLLMFFDYTPRNRSFSSEYIRQFINDHRTFRWPEAKPQVSEERVSEIFGCSSAELKKLNKKELNRLYRKKAMELHPDLGGEHDRFVELTAVYENLSSKK